MFNGLGNFQSMAPFEIHGTAYTMESYDKMYSPFFFIFWEEDCDDWRYMFGGKPHVDLEMLERLRNKCTTIGSNLFRDADFLNDPISENRPVASNGFDGYESTSAEWSLEYDDPVFDDFSPYMIAKRSIARKRPSEVRDIGILTPGSMRSHRRFMRPLQRLCTRLPNCPHGRDQAYIKALVTHFGMNYDYFYMRDYTKSGMTVPHEVIKAVFEGLYIDQPELCKLACDFYDKGVVMVDYQGTPTFRHPDTGVPLGLWVEGYTILQYALHMLIVQDMPDYGEANRLAHTATNDDMLVGCRNPEVLDDYVNRDTAVNTALGMAVKFAKSGTSYQSFFYCEEYWYDQGLEDKNSLFALGILGAKCAVNIVHAKDLVHSILMSAPDCNCSQVLAALREVQTFWGAEFTEQEHAWPFLFGGWLPQLKNGVDYSLDWYSGDFIANCAYWAASIKYYKRKKLDSKPHLTLGRKLDVTLLEQPDNPSLWADLIPIFGDKKTLQMHFGRLPAKAVTKRYNLLAKSRHERFCKLVTGKVETPDLYVNWYKRHPASVIRDWMPGVVRKTEFKQILKPRLGIRTISEICKLICMHLQRMISLGSLGNNQIKLSRSEVVLFGHGVTEELKINELRVPLTGVGVDMLSTQYAGLDQYYEDHPNVAFQSLTGELPLDFTQTWAHMPTAVATDAIRMRNNLRRAQLPADPDVVDFFYQRMYNKVSDTLEDWGYEYHDAVLGKERLLDRIQLTFSDLFEPEQAAEAMENIRSRIVPAFNSYEDPVPSLGKEASSLDFVTRRETSGEEQLVSDYWDAEADPDDFMDLEAMLGG
jgi:hypothetical protein